MDEAAGDVALRADPESPEAFAEAIVRALDSPGDAAERGIAHAAQFTWLETGRAFLAGYGEAA
jgi:hypothetical protein